MDLSGKRVVILGGTSGIGLAIAAAVAKAGAVPIVASSRASSVEAALAQLPAGAEGHSVDLRDSAAIANLFDTIGLFDHLAYTAGESLALGPLAETDLEAARGFFEIRFWGAVTAAKHAARHLRPGGSITLTSGVAGLRPRSGWVLGASLCTAMEGLMRALAVELAPIRVNLVTPGFVRSPLWRNIAEAEREAMYASVGQSLPVGRVGEPAEIAATYLFLMQQGFATGQSVVVDGGGVLV